MDQLGAWDLVLSVMVLFAFAVAQPLLDLLGRNPEFFLARAAPKIDIWLVVLAAVLILPSLLALVAWGARAIHPIVGAVVHSIIFTVLGAAMAIALIEHSPARELPDWAELAVAALVGVALWDVFIHFAWARAAVRFASIGPLVFAAAFALFSPTAQLLSAAGPLEKPAGVVVDNPVPVVLVVFDEFPLASLIDAEGNIPERIYPTFARLAEEGVWFRNAVGVEQQTEEAIPTILTGRHPADRDAIPTASDYPLNLFSLLADVYEIRASESVTELCPSYACSNRTRVVSPPADRWPTLASDLSIVSAHLLLPPDLTRGLPSIRQTWGDFAGATPEAREQFNLIGRFNEVLDEDRRKQVARFIGMLAQPTNRPTFYFAHLLFPHVPWTYLPNGQAYSVQTPAPGSTAIGWASDEWLVMQAYQRHLLQVQYADTIVGRIIATLESRGVYDDALILIVADHGAADAPDIDFRRAITDATVGHIAAVPMFLKMPGEKDGHVDDYRAETTDVLPTIADVLGMTVPWEVEGTSLLSTDRPTRTSSTMIGSRGSVTFDASGNEKLEVAAWKESWFLDGEPFGLAPRGYHDLLGTSLASLRPTDDTGLEVQIRRASQYSDLDPTAEPFPAQVTGTLTGSAAFNGDVVLAISLNGRVEAVVRTFDTDGRTTSFQAILPPEAFRAGANRIEVVLVDGTAGTRSYSLASG